ncbi:hypothetical protein LPJ66_003991 [Kickxella alabastrina]|uniref:Uncharacterized protein n=1 Tax=Kickxella alabastrina TaxID=61397 RepID=A0ACC1IJ82_9FUNG|nr:hypothetical protein LPJ66_003991 [Kickxella alabastrina]
MKLEIQLFYISGFAASLLAVESKPGIFDNFRWPWGSSGNQDIPLPGIFTLNSDVSTYSHKCILSMMNIGSKFDLSCYQGAKYIYFTSPGEICKPQCLNTTIALSQYVVHQCNLENKVLPPIESIGYNHKDFVYLSWADSKLANLVCNGPANERGKDERDQLARCYSAVFTAETIRQTDSLARDELPKDYVCNSCTREWVNTLRNGKYYISPILYYGHISNAPRLAAWISEQCGYNMAPF